jgi:hypothetical protein
LIGTSALSYHGATGVLLISGLCVDGCVPVVAEQGGMHFVVFLPIFVHSLLLELKIWFLLLGIGYYFHEQGIFSVLDVSRWA